jgi:hypothetical protein
MATLALSAVGAAAGAAAFPGLSLLGGTVTGAVLGRAAGAVAGAYIDAALFSSSGQTDQRSASSRDYKITASTEGADIPRVYGRARVGGQIIWATHILRLKMKGSGSGKGLTGSSGSGSTYKYYANWAVALCEGPITRLGRVWADGEEINLADYAHRVYFGTEDQLADSLIIAKEGADNAPAYRGLAYIVFDGMDLEKFGNRIPQLNFEVFRAVDDLETQIQAVTLIPAASEFAYETIDVTRDDGFGGTVTQNRHTNAGATNVIVSLDQLQESLPNCGTVSLFVTWFGTDLRCGECQIAPKVEYANKETRPYSWRVAGLNRDDVDEVSLSDNRPAFGGTPTDASVIRCIQEMHARGLEVAFTPFLLMDIPAGNTKTDPYTGAASQPVYPWRGRITCHPAPGQPGSPDGSSAVDAQVNAFVSEYRDFILHYANLCADAGGVEIFAIGTELRGLTWIRNGAGSYPFVTALKTLAADVSAILPSAKITYAADWSEWFGHQPGDGSGDVYFHLDPLWSDANIDAIGIDNYWPLSDWRDGTSHADFLSGYRDPRDLAYLKSNVQGGEGYDWFYADEAARQSQTRTPITDGAGRPWVFRYKDIKNWWLNQHYNRPGGVESGTPTGWVPQSKPFWFMEYGCPAVDRGSNQPNVFVDPKSSESFFPYFSRGFRDDLIQRRYIKAMIETYDPAAESFDAALNPVSSVYSGRMVDPSKMFVYTWDARPYPAFPNNTLVWTDGANWEFGHWLTGRAAAGPLAETVRTILEDTGFLDFDAGGLSGSMQGYLVDRVASARDMLQPLEMGYFFDSVESGGRIVFRHRARGGSLASLTVDDLVETRAGEPRYTLTRAQETELARAAKLTYTDPNRDYETGSAEARMLTVASSRIAQASLPIVIDYDQAVRTAETWLHESWAGRETLSMTLPPSMMRFEPGDMITVNAGGMTRDYRITGAELGGALRIEGRSIEAHIYDGFATAKRDASAAEPIVYGEPVVAFMDLPLITGAETPHAGRIAAFSRPFGGVAVYRSPTISGFDLNVLIEDAATLGESVLDFFSGPTSRFDHGNSLRVRLYDGELAGVSDILLFGGANLAAIENADGEWEVLQFGAVELVSAGVYDLRRLLRGQFGTESAMRSPVAAGARFVVLDEAVVEAAMTADERNLAFNYKAGPAPYDISHPAFASETRAFSGLGLRPYSPVHVRASRNGSGDLTLTWVRRNRLGADSWEQTDIPMSEASEAYEVDIMDGASVKRTLTATSPSVIYTAAQQATDFGSTQGAVSVRVYQMSQVFGRGAVRAAMV